MNKKAFCKTALALATTALFSATTSAQTFSTDFEFVDRSGEFTLNDSGNTVTFTGGAVDVISVGFLYRSGIHSFLFQQGSAEITFEEPVQSVTFFLRDRTEDVQSTINIFESDSVSPSLTVQGNRDAFTEVTFSSDVGITRIQGINNTDEYAAIDDFSFVDFAQVVDPDAPIALDDPIPDPIPSSGISLDLELIADTLTSPIIGVTAPGVDGFFFIAEQDGNIWALNEQTDEISLVISLADQIVTGVERGLIGLAFHPDFSSNGLLYTQTSQVVDGTIDFLPTIDSNELDNISVITQWTASTNDATGISIDPSSASTLMTIGQPQGNHNGGALVFDNSNNLLIAVGDGGSADDQGTGHSEGGNGQDSSNVLGSILRIDPLGVDSANGNYGVPADNPFINDENIPNEIFTTGLRNPFKIYFDSDTSTLFAADVGQNNVEEINIVNSGDNFGWPQREGPFGFFNNGESAGFVFDQAASADFVEPIAAYDHDEGIAIIGGVVYGGDIDDNLTGRYVFADILGRVFSLNESNDIEEVALNDNPIEGQGILGFGNDNSNQLFIFTRDFENNVGRVFRINNTEVETPAPAPEPNPEPTPEPTPEVTPELVSESSGGGALNLFFSFFLLIGIFLKRTKR
ncbi:PQQ-dependent sugar dehydrogenase [Alteromonas sp. 5E99-2]|uniref:PQQ-dependent sugar dehydrogenase n=1 Tax=Alteromonas sp. 5E99-2 TaxID=2817683 RepID=UPI001A994987|nr:PQQ-dependent sugar dehydrogenase [Alteromonas sp. 5E99-2]MBO1255986.1 PQQ-dependent sugar dehydrogenase [Alteromonas sp. 5E99-2]